MASPGRDHATKVYGCIVGECNVRLWGLSSAERLQRVFERAGVAGLASETDELDPAATVIFVRADYLYDERVIRDLVGAPNVGLQVHEGGRAIRVAAHVSSARACVARRWLHGEAGAQEMPGIQIKFPDALSEAYDEKLLRSEPATVVRIGPDRRAALERHLFNGSYKGVTDFVTKWLWPAPARWATHLCTRAGIRPNHVTILSVLLVVMVTFLFATGRYGFGLGLAWLMTFLDTVDGKLARVTVGSTSIGHALDHGLDIIHPPFWYLAWGMGLEEFQAPLEGLTLDLVLGTVVVGYVVGRLVEGAFTLWVGRFSLFCWRPIDSYSRLVLARRNPNLTLLTGGLLAPDVGIMAVATWTLTCAVFLSVRLTMAVHRRTTCGPLRPWLAVPQGVAGDASGVSRPFVPHPTVRPHVMGLG
ncbi:MAG: CDP-alcohol phosphatidyltransferase family protein [Candidatus Binatia bacterium]